MKLIQNKLHRKTKTNCTSVFDIKFLELQSSILQSAMVTTVIFQDAHFPPRSPPASIHHAALLLRSSQVVILQVSALHCLHHNPIYQWDTVIIWTAPTIRQCRRRVLGVCRLGAAVKSIPSSSSSSSSSTFSSNGFLLFDHVTSHHLIEWCAVHAIIETN